jgi:hypothetical protein
MVQEIWQKFNANERLAAIGSIVVIVAWLLGVVSAYGFGASTIALLAALAVLVIYYLKYAPNQNVNWPLPIPTLVLAISAIGALFALLSALQWLSLISFAGILFTLALIGTVVGAGIMVWGAWQEYQAMPKTAAPTPPSGAPPASPPPPPPPSTPGTPG